MLNKIYFLLKQKLWFYKKEIMVIVQKSWFHNKGFFWDIWDFMKKSDFFLTWKKKSIYFLHKKNCNLEGKSH